MTDVVPSDPRNPLTAQTCRLRSCDRKLKRSELADMLCQEHSASAHSTTPSDPDFIGNCELHGEWEGPVDGCPTCASAHTPEPTAQGQQVDNLSELDNLYQVAGNDLVKKYPKTLERLANPPSNVERQEAKNSPANPQGLNSSFIHTSLLAWKAGDISMIELREAIRQTLLAALPEPKPYQEPQDLAEHWGMTESSQERIISNMKALGRNELLTEIVDTINRLLGADHE